MARRKLLLTGVSLALAMTGCSMAGEENPTETAAGLTADVLEETTTSASTEEAVQIVLSEELQGIPEFTGKLDFTYMFDTDAQAEVQETDNIAYTQEGYYSWQDGYGAKMLYYCDWESGQSVPVCGKSNCAHQGEGVRCILREQGVSHIWYLV